METVVRVLDRIPCHMCGVGRFSDGTKCVNCGNYPAEFYQSHSEARKLRQSASIGDPK